MKREKQIVESVIKYPSPEPSRMHLLMLGDCRQLATIPGESIHLVVSSLPYFNAPHDYLGFFASYDDFLLLLTAYIASAFRALREGRILCLNLDDMLVNGIKYPIVADAIRIALEAGFAYRDKIVWVKPDGYTVRSRRSSSAIQHPFPMYTYLDNQSEFVLIFQKGKFDYSNVPNALKHLSKLDIALMQKERWFSNVWRITNVLPSAKLEKGIAAYPDALVERLIAMYSYFGETVLDGFLGSGTTMKVADQLGRLCVGYEINEQLVPVILAKTGLKPGIDIEIIRKI